MVRSMAASGVPFSTCHTHSGHVCAPKRPIFERGRRSPLCRRAENKHGRERGPRFATILVGSQGWPTLDRGQPWIQVALMYSLLWPIFIFDGLFRWKDSAASLKVVDRFFFSIRFYSQEMVDFENIDFDKYKGELSQYVRVNMRLF